jgi:hypothetical protein
MRGEETVLTETQQQVGLTHPTVANDQQFNQVVVTLFPLHYY